MRKTKPIKNYRIDAAPNSEQLLNNRAYSLHWENAFDLGGFARYSVSELSGAFKRGALSILPSSCYGGLVLCVSGPG